MEFSRLTPTGHAQRAGGERSRETPRLPTCVPDRHTHSRSARQRRVAASDETGVLFRDIPQLLAIRGAISIRRPLAGSRREGGATALSSYDILSGQLARGDMFIPRENWGDPASDILSRPQEDADSAQPTR